MSFELDKIYLQEIEDLIDEGKWKVLIEKVLDLHSADIAEILDELNVEDAIAMYKCFPEERAAEIMVELDEDLQEKLVAELSSKQIAEELIENLDSDDAADIIGALPEDRKVEVITQIEDIEQAKQIVDLLNYPEDTAGALMAKELIKVNHNWSVLQCVREMRRQAEEIDEVHAIYVVDDDNILLGTLSLKKLLTTTTKTPVKEVFNSKVRSVQANMNDEELARLMQKYDLVVVPVVDELGRLLGRITIDDVMDVMREEAEKDYQLASGISESVESDDSVYRLTRARLPWLLIGLFGGVLGAQIIGLFEIKENLEMAFFIPLIAAMGGNVGVQSSAIIVQALANKTEKFQGLFARLMKELSVSILNGLVCSLIILGAVVGLGYDVILAITVSISLLLVIIFAALFGTFVPLTLSKYNIDPAVATGPFITTANDMLGLFIYFSIGKILLGA